MRGRILLIAALAAPALSGCGGFGFGDFAPLSASGGLNPPPAGVGAAPALQPAAAAPVQPVQSASIAPPAVAAAPAPPPPPPIPTGAALGGVLGGSIGASLADADRAAAWKAQLAALDSGQRKSWRGGQGVFGFVEPGAETGGGCRAYSQTIYVAGRPNRGQGVACKDPAGGWRMTS